MRCQRRSDDFWTGVGIATVAAVAFWLAVGLAVLYLLGGVPS